MPVKAPNRIDAFQHSLEKLFRTQLVVDTWREVYFRNCNNSDLVTHLKFSFAHISPMSGRKFYHSCGQSAAQSRELRSRSDWGTVVRAIRSGLYWLAFVRRRMSLRNR